MNATKITNRKTTVKLTKNFNNKVIKFPKGTLFDARTINENGVNVTCGQGWNEVIPHDYLGNYTETYNVVHTVNNTTTTTAVKEDVTHIWLAHWQKLANRKTEIARHQKLTNLRKQIADLRKTIKYVTNGTADNELKQLLNQLA